VEGIGEIHPPAVPTDFNHLWTTTQRLVGFGRMWRLSNNPADVNRGRFLWMERVGYIVLDKFSCTPAGGIEKSIVQRENNIGDERRHGLEALKQWRELFGISRLSWDFNDFLYLPRSVLSVPEPN